MVSAPRSPWVGFACAILIGIVLGGLIVALNEVWQARSYPAEHIKGIEELGATGQAMRGFKIGAIIGALCGFFVGLLYLVGGLSKPTDS